MRADENDPQKGTFDVTMSDAFGLRRTDSGVSQSGHERNNLFLGHGDQYLDVSGVSGFDSPADARSVARIDYDRDGWLDLAVVNANRPFLQIFRNEIGALLDKQGETRHMLALRFVGGNHTPQAASGLAARDGYGAVAEIDVDGATLVREHRAGEGFATQNSATIQVGLGAADRAEQLRVRWPSGKVQQLEGVGAGSLVTAYEDASQSPDGSGFAIEPYRKASPVRTAPRALHRKLDIVPPSKNGNGIRLLTTMATWCETCKGELPQIARLRREFGEDELALLAVPVDEDDTPEKLDAYEAKQKPAYEFLRGLTEQQVESVKDVVVHDLRVDVMPASIITDSQGRILKTQANVPSVSEIRELLGPA